MPGFWKILYKHKASLSMLPRNLHSSITCSSKRFLISSLLNLDVSPSIKNWGKTNWNFLFISLTWKQKNLLLPQQRLMPQVTFKSHADICYLPWPPLTSPSLLPRAAGTAHSPSAGTRLVSPGGDGKRNLLTVKKKPAGWWETKWLQ